MDKIFNGSFDALNFLDVIFRSSSLFVSKNGINDDGLPFVIVGCPECSETVTINAVGKRTFTIKISEK